ncbi:MAG: YfhO family protein, partial [Lachnospiraceae bacterium]|nr:YfhO family protein [Lachnospiraceae bacterium]
WRLYAALMTASVFCSFYMTIIVFIFSIIYTAVYDYSDLPHALRNILLKLMSDVLAAGAGAVIILNSVGGSFFQKEISIKFPYGGVRNSFFDVLKALFPKVTPSSTEYYGYGIDIFCGILAVFLIILYVANPNISVRRRMSQSSILVILTTGLIFFTPNYIFNGFFYSDAAFSVFGFLFVVQLLSMAYEALLNLEHTPVWQILAAIALLAALIALTPKFCDGYSTIQPVIYAMEFLALGSILILLYRSNSMTKWLLLTLLPLSLMAEICLTYVDNLRRVGSESTRYEETTDSRMYEISRLIHEKNANARIYYCRTEDDVNTPVLNTLLGYDFILAPVSVKNVDSLLEPVEVFNEIQIYKNPYSANAIIVPEGVKDWTFDRTYPFMSYNNLITNILGGVPVYDEAVGEYNLYETVPMDEDNNEDKRKLEYYCQFDAAESGDLYISFFGLRHLGIVQGGRSADLTHTITQKDRNYGSTSAVYAFFNSDSFRQFYGLLNQVEPQGSITSKLQYQINAPKGSYLLLPSDSKNSLSYTVNNASAKAVAFNDSASLIPLQEGDNTVTVSVRPVLLYWGFAITALFLIVLIFLAVRNRIVSVSGPRAIHAVSSFIRDNYVYIVTFCIATAVFILTQMYTSSSPFGDKATLVSDGYTQAYNGYVGRINDIKNGSYGVLNWNIGISIDRYNDMASYFTSPWNYLRALILPESLYLFDLTFSYYISFVTAGLYMILYLTHRHGRRMDKKDCRLIVIGTIYGLCSYNISFFIYGSFGFLTSVPLILLAMELLIYKKKPFLYIFLLFGNMGDAYYAFMLCEFIFLYFFTMHFDSIKDMFFKGIRILMASVAAALLSCYRLIPYYLRTLESPYKVLDTVTPVTKTNGSYLSLISDSTTFHEPTIVTDNDYKANLYIGILLLFLIPLYLLNKRVKLSIRIRRTILVVLYFIAFGNSTLNFIFHGFHYQSKVPNRFAAFFLVLLVIMFYDVLLSIREYSSKAVGLSIGAASLVLIPLWIWAFTEAYISDITLTMTLCFAGVYLFLGILQLWKKHKKTVYKAALIICLLEVVMSALYSFRYLGHNATEEASTGNIQTLADRHPDMTAPFTSTEIIGDRSDNRAEGTAIRSISAFSSFMTQDHIKQFNRWNLLTATNYIYYLGGNPLADMMLHVKYHITNNYVENSWSHYDVIDRINNLTLHENPYYLPLGIFFTDTEEIRKWNSGTPDNYKDEHGINPLLYQNAFMHAMGYNDLYQMIEPETDPASLTEDFKDDKTYIMTDQSDYMAGISNEVPVWVYTAKDVEGDIFVSYNNMILYIGTAEKGKANEFTFTMQIGDEGAENYYIRLATVNYDELDKLHKELESTVMTDIQTHSSTITGIINTPDNGFVYLSLPDMPGWQCYVDGAPVDHVNFLSGIGIPVTVGEHELQIRYTPRGMWTGILISVGALILIILYAIFRKRLIRKPGSNVDPILTEETNV